MSALDPALDAALSADTVTIALLVRIDLPNGDTVRLLEGAGSVPFSGGVFTGEDPRYASLGEVDDFEDGTGDQAPGIALQLLPVNPEAAILLTDPAMQGAPVRVWLGALSDATGLLIGEPYLLLAAEVDLPTLEIGEGVRAVELDCVGGMERFFEAEEGIRLTPARHKQVWPGELGLDHVTGITDPIFWGAATPSGVRT